MNDAISGRAQILRDQSREMFGALDQMANDNLDRVASDYKDKFGQEPGTYSTEGYDLGTIMLKGIDAGKITRPDLLEWVRTYNAPGVVGAHLQRPRRGAQIPVDRQGRTDQHPDLDLQGSVVVTTGRVRDHRARTRSRFGNPREEPATG